MEEAPGDMGRSRSVRVLPLSRLVSWSNSRRFCSVMRWGWGALYRGDMVRIHPWHADPHPTLCNCVPVVVVVVAGIPLGSVPE